MADRWVCKQCFADNEDADAACTRCGLARGALVDDTDRATWMQPAGTGRGRDWSRLLRFWWIPVLVVVLAVGYLTTAQRDDAGAISDAGTLHIEDLRVGDCFDFEDADEISDVEALPCSEPHGYELFHVATWSGRDAYPDEEALVDFVIDTCVPAFDEYVGVAYEASVIDFVPFTPTEEGWDAGDRVIQCALIDPEQPRVTTSLRGADR